MVLVCGIALNTCFRVLGCVHVAPLVDLPTINVPKRFPGFLGVC